MWPAPVARAGRRGAPRCRWSWPSPGMRCDGTSPYFSIRLNAHSHSPPSASAHHLAAGDPRRRVSPSERLLAGRDPVDPKQRRARLFQQVEEIQIGFGEGLAGGDAALLQRRRSHQHDRREQPAVARLLLVLDLAEGQHGRVAAVVPAQDVPIERGGLESAAAQTLGVRVVERQPGDWRARLTRVIQSRPSTSRRGSDLGRVMESDISGVMIVPVLTASSSDRTRRAGAPRCRAGAPAWRSRALRPDRSPARSARSAP